MQSNTSNTNTVEWFKNEFSKRNLTALVFFRGLWCPWCNGYLHELNKSFVHKIRAAGGELFAVTAQDDGGKTATKEWDLLYDTVIDPSNELARHLQVNVTPKAATPFSQHPTWYPHGLAQPALIVVDRQGRSLFHWAIVPSEMNLGGASDRPLPDAVWQVVEAQLKQYDQAKATDTAQLPREDWDWLRDNYRPLYEGMAQWFKGELAAGRMLQAPRPSDL